MAKKIKGATNSEKLKASQIIVNGMPLDEWLKLSKEEQIAIRRAK